MTACNKMLHPSQKLFFIDTHFGLNLIETYKLFLSLSFGH